MALVKRFNLELTPPDLRYKKTWLVRKLNYEYLDDADLNRAIVYCVAAMQAAKERG